MDAEEDGERDGNQCKAVDADKVHLCECACDGCQQADCNLLHVCVCFKLIWGGVGKRTPPSTMTAQKVIYSFQAGESFA